MMSICASLYCSTLGRNQSERASESEWLPTRRKEEDSIDIGVSGGRRTLVCPFVYVVFFEWRNQWQEGLEAVQRWQWGWTREKEGKSIAVAFLFLSLLPDYLIDRFPLIPHFFLFSCRSVLTWTARIPWVFLFFTSRLQMRREKESEIRFRFDRWAKFDSCSPRHDVFSRRDEREGKILAMKSLFLLITSPSSAESSTSLLFLDPLDLEERRLSTHSLHLRATFSVFVFRCQWRALFSLRTAFNE